MTHPADFADAHRRHWEDAELLFDAGRWANADQLYGFSAECGLKAVMKSLGMPVDASGVPEEERHRVHVQHLWPMFRDFAEARRAAQFVRLLPAEAPFADWSHHDRYANRRYFDAERAERHRDAAGAVRDMVLRARRGGMPL